MILYIAPGTKPPHKEVFASKASNNSDVLLGIMGSNNKGINNS